MKRRTLTLVVHALCLGCMFSAIILEVLVFKDIATKGYFYATEPRPAILAFEIFTAALNLSYLAYLGAYWLKHQSNGKRRRT